MCSKYSEAAPCIIAVHVKGHSVPCVSSSKCNCAFFQEQVQPHVQRRGPKTDGQSSFSSASGYCPVGLWSKALASVGFIQGFLLGEGRTDYKMRGVFPAEIFPAHMSGIIPGICSVPSAGFRMVSVSIIETERGNNDSPLEAQT